MRTQTVIILLSVFIPGLLTGCGPKKEEQSLSAQELIVDPAKSGKLPRISFIDSTYDFGSVEAGKMVSHSYRFINTGEADLVITNAQASCGCTVPTFPRNPIAPGDSGQIDVEFNSTGRSGAQTKTVTVFANTSPGAVELRLLGRVTGIPENGPVKE